MLAIVVLGLLACEGVTSFKFVRTRNYNREVDHSNGGGYAFLNRQKVDIFNRKEVLDREIESINRQKEDLDRRIEYLNQQKERLDNDIESIDNEIDKINPGYGPKIYNSRYHGQGTANGYIVIMPLPGYREDEISVKAENGRLEINAIHDVLGEPVISYIHRRDLPNDVDLNGSWSYKWGVLRVCFPAIQNQNTFLPTFTTFTNKLFTEKDISYNENPTTHKVVLNGVFESSSTTSRTQNNDSKSGNNMDIPLSTTHFPVLELEDKEATEPTTDFTTPSDIETTTFPVSN